MPIYICGFMGSGKSHCGRNAALRLDLNFTDLDSFIRNECDMIIPDIFRLHGEGYFRERELDALKKTVSRDLISLGGGTLTYEKSLDFVKKNGKVVFINTDFDTCFARISGDISRPLASGKSRDELFSLYNERRKQYIAAADFTIDSEDALINVITLKG